MTYSAVHVSDVTVATCPCSLWTQTPVKRSHTLTEQSSEPLMAASGANCGEEKTPNPLIPFWQLRGDNSPGSTRCITAANLVKEQGCYAATVTMQRIQWQRIFQPEHLQPQQMMPCKLPSQNSNLQQSSKSSVTTTHSLAYSRVLPLTRLEFGF